MVNKYDDNDDDDDDDNAYLIRWVVVQLFFRTKCHRTVMFLTINNDSLTENKQEIQLSLTGRAQHHIRRRNATPVSLKSLDQTDPVRTGM